MTKSYPIFQLYLIIYFKVLHILINLPLIMLLAVFLDFWIELGLLVTNYLLGQLNFLRLYGFFQLCSDLI